MVLEKKNKPMKMFFLKFSIIFLGFGKVNSNIDISYYGLLMKGNYIIKIIEIFK